MVAFSLIVPFYATDIAHKDWRTSASLIMLREMLTSIPARDDLEILICPDRTEIPDDFIEEFGSKKIRIVEDNGMPMAGAARNRGIDAARGDWLLFADSDDRFTQQMSCILSKVAALPDRAPDIIFFHVTSFEDGMKDGSGKRSHYGEKMLALAERDNDRGFLTNIFTPYGRIVRKSFVLRGGIRFGVGRVANDLPFGVDVAINTAEFQILSETGYSIRHRSNSLDRLTDPQSIVQRMKEKRAANRRLTRAGLARYRLPLFMHHVDLLKVSPAKGVVEIAVSLVGRDQILPQIWRIKERRSESRYHVIK